MLKVGGLQLAPGRVGKGRRRDAVGNIIAGSFAGRPSVSVRLILRVFVFREYHISEFFDLPFKFTSCQFLILYNSRQGCQTSGPFAISVLQSAALHGYLNQSFTFTIAVFSSVFLE